MNLTNNCLIIFALVLLGLSCKQSMKSSAVAADGNKNRFEKSVITLEKTECYGTCPIYTITIYGTGKVMYEGKKHVKKEGKYEKQLKGKEVSKLFNAYECANFFDFKTEYTDELLMDLPTTYVTFEHRGFKKKITDYHGAPEELKNLEKMVEEIAESEEGWTKVE